ncbi:hypothetical protein GCM10017752_36120 [Streptomyces roseoviridis]
MVGAAPGGVFRVARHHGRGGKGRGRVAGGKGAVAGGGDATPLQPCAPDPAAVMKTGRDTAAVRSRSPNRASGTWKRRPPSRTRPPPRAPRDADAYERVFFGASVLISHTGRLGLTPSRDGVAVGAVGIPALGVASGAGVVAGAAGVVAGACEVPRGFGVLPPSPGPEPEQAARARPRPSTVAAITVPRARTPTTPPQVSPGS